MEELENLQLTQITDEVKDKWQNIITIMANIINVPTGLIMRRIGADIEVYLSSKTNHNPYHPGDKEHFDNSGLYCETVIKTRKMLLVPNALSDEHWKDNPDVKLNMISYLGFPIHLPDKTPIGTICVLDNKENQYSELFINLVSSFRDMIEKDLELIWKTHNLHENNLKLNQLLTEKEILLKETQHRIKNNIANIEGLILLQAQSAKSFEVKIALQDVISRIQSIRILYEKLLLSNDIHEISMKDYIESLINSLYDVFVDQDSIVIEKDITEFNIKANHAITIGIIMNELLTNIFKYAFKERNNGRIFISVNKNEKSITLTMQDNGIGFSNDQHQTKSTGFGLMLVKMLVEQLKGTYSVASKNGTTSIIEFALE